MNIVRDKGNIRLVGFEGVFFCYSVFFYVIVRVFDNSFGGSVLFFLMRKSRRRIVGNLFKV